MERLGYSAAKPLAVKVATRNIAEFRDPAVILLDQLKQIHIAGELDVIDTSQWYNRVTKRDYAVGLNLTGSSVDDPDVTLVENFSCKSERNYTQYCNADVEALICPAVAGDRHRQAQAARVGGRKGARRGRGAAHHLAHLCGHLLASLREELCASITTASTTTRGWRTFGWTSRRRVPRCRCGPTHKFRPAPRPARAPATPPPAPHALPPRAAHRRRRPVWRPRRQGAGGRRAPPAGPRRGRAGGA